MHPKIISPTTAEQLPHGLLELLSERPKIFVLTGAGVSAESGLQTFRDKRTGLWAQFDPRRLATADAFVQDAALVWGWYEWRRQELLKAQPNAGHDALAALQSQFPSFTLVTQNVDDLHERAGSSSVVHLHGQLLVSRCFDCGRKQPTPNPAIGHTLTPQRVQPPACVACGGLLRPDVVWFGEELPADELESARKASRECDLFLCIGTSAEVYPAAELPHEAIDAGAMLVVVNEKRTPVDRSAHHVLRGQSGTILPLLERAARFARLRGDL